MLQAPDVMSGYQHRTASPLQLVEDVGDDAPGLGVDGVERLVEEEELCLLGQRPGKQHSLLLAAGELAQLPRRQVVEGELAEHSTHNLPVLAPRTPQPSEMDVAAGEHELGDGHRKAPAQLAALGEIRHPVMAAPDPQPVDAHPPLLEGQSAGEHPQQGGLAGTIGPDDGDAHARRHAEVDASQGRRSAPRIASHQLRDVDRRRPGHGIALAAAAVGKSGMLVCRHDEGPSLSGRARFPLRPEVSLMRVVEDAWNADKPPRGAVVTIGNFDALHRGHQALIRNVVERARDAGTPAGLVTFEPHPVQVLRPDAGLRRLTTRQQKLALLAAQGLDAVFLISFDHRFADVEASTFADEFLGRRLALREVHVGERFRFGRGRAGDLPLLQKIGERRGYRAFGVEEVFAGGEPISSTRIRQAVVVGDVELAMRLLGRPYALEGTVTEGDGRGRHLGWPTANLALASELPPAPGVYVAEAIGADDDGHPAAVNVGVRPTVDPHRTDPVVEAHLLDFQGDLYGRHLELQLLRRLRGEERFADLDALKAQIGRDVEAVREYFAPTRR